MSPLFTTQQLIRGTKENLEERKVTYEGRMRTFLQCTREARFISVVICRPPCWCFTPSFLASHFPTHVIEKGKKVSLHLDFEVMLLCLFFCLPIVGRRRVGLYYFHAQMEEEEDLRQTADNGFESLFP